MLADVNDVIKRAQVLLDDPAGSIFSAAYLLPHIDMCYDELDVELENAGMQYIESIAVFDVAAGVSDLSNLLQDGQPLATMKLPKNLRWKLQGQPDSTYSRSAFVSELSDVDPAASIGALEWRFGDGGLQVLPSSVGVTCKLYFDQMSTNVVDGTTGVVRGTAHILALDVAISIDQGRKGMESRLKLNSARRAKAWNGFKDVLTKNNQGKKVEPPRLHPRRSFVAPAGYA